MTDLDTLVRQHADQARRAVAGVIPPSLDLTARRLPTDVLPPYAWALVAAVIVILAIGIPFWLSGDNNEPVDTTVEEIFQTTGSMSGGCFWCPATLLDDGTVLTLTSDPEEGYLAEIYEPEAGSFTLTGKPQNDYNHGAAVRLDDGRVLLIAGLTDQAEIYDPASGEFEVIDPPLVDHRGEGTAVLLAEGRVLVVGGLTADAEIYDPGTGEFALTGSMTIQRGSPTATLLDDGRVLVVGTGTADLFDPSTGTFTETGPMVVPRGGHTATLLPDGRVLIVGGSGEEEAYPNLDSAELFDPETETFVATGSMATPRFWHATVLRHDGRVLVIGGNDDEGWLDSVEVYDPATGRFEPLGVDLTRPRNAATAVVLADGRVLVMGAYGFNVGGPDAGSDTAEVLGPAEASG